MQDRENSKDSAKTIGKLITPSVRRRPLPFDETQQNARRQG